MLPRGLYVLLIFFFLSHSSGQFLTRTLGCSLLDRLSQHFHQVLRLLSRPSFSNRSSYVVIATNLGVKIAKIGLLTFIRRSGGASSEN